MTTIEDELRAVLDGFSEHGAPVTDRSAAVNARIQHHQRVRAAGLAAVLVIAIAVAGGVISTGWLHPARHSTPPAGPVYEPAPKPGHVATYAGGGRLVTSGSATMPDTTTITLTFTPTNWDFTIGDACVAPARIWVATFVNGHPLSTSGCASTGGNTMVGGGEWDMHEPFWFAMGVRLGTPVTVTAEIGTKLDSDPSKVTATNDPGLASIGIYSPVRWADYHFPAPPAQPAPLAEVQADLPHTLATLSGTARNITITLPARIQMTCSASAPGLLRIYVNGTEVDECNSWSYGNGGSGSVLTAGKGRLFGLSVGDKVEIDVWTWHFPSPTDWQVTIFGS